MKYSVANHHFPKTSCSQSAPVTSRRPCIAIFSSTLRYTGRKRDDRTRKSTTSSTRLTKKTPNWPIAKIGWTRVQTAGFSAFLDSVSKG